MIRLEHDGVRWELQPDFAPLLAKVSQNIGRVLKESPAKLVTVVHVEGRTFYVKRYRSSAVLFRPLKYYFKASEARREWQLAQRLQTLGVPAVRHLALGERWHWTGLRESILVTEGFPGISADEIANLDAAKVFAFIQAMHERGVIQEDLHPANLLVRTEPFEIRLVDLYGTRIKRALTQDERDRNLALLHGALPIPVSSEIARLSETVRKERLHYRSKRCLKHNREFAPQRHGGLHWWVRLPFCTEAVKRILQNPDEFLKSRAEILKPGRTATVGRADGLVLKRFNFKKAENLFKDLFRQSRGRRAYRKAYHLELLGIPTARPIAMAERRVFGVLLRSYFLMEEIPNAVELGTYLRDGRPPETALVKQAAELVARLHNEGFSHRDLKQSNIVLGADGKVHLLDLDGVKFLRTVPDSRAVADLERLARGVAKYSGVSTRHRAAFLRVYCRARGLKRLPRLV